MGRNERKKGYITVRKVALPENDLSYDKREVEDVLVKSWLISSMTDNLMSHFVQFGILFVTVMYNKRFSI